MKDKLKFYSTVGTILAVAGGGISILKGWEESKREQQEKDIIESRLAALEERVEYQED